MDKLTDGLCGPTRPGHFTGVATVCTKLFNIVRPHVASFGEKDYQQLAVIRRLVRDLNLPVSILAHPTVREADGLAMSSRNAYLDPEERKRALCLVRALERARALVDGGERDAGILREAMAAVVRDVGGEGAGIDYIEIVDPDRFTPLDRIGEAALAALAVRIGPARLIDNMTLIG